MEDRKIVERWLSDSAVKVIMSEFARVGRKSIISFEVVTWVASRALGILVESAVVMHVIMPNVSRQIIDSAITNLENFRKEYYDE